MSFLDNLENSLKALEGRAEHEGNDREQREKKRQAEIAAAPWAEKLKGSPYTQQLMSEAARAGFQHRGKVYMAWLGATLRLEFREKRLELRPEPDGIRAVFLVDNVETASEQLALEGSPAELVGRWLGATPKSEI